MRIEGYFDGMGQPRVDLRVAGFTRPVSAVIDTGFNGAIRIHIEQAVAAGLEVVDAQIYLTIPTGERVKFLLCDGEIDWFGEKISATMLVNIRRREPDDTQERSVLVGTELLSRCNISIDYCNRIVALEECS
jgi:predicted aspartyl protease